MNKYIFFYINLNTHTHTHTHTHTQNDAQNALLKITIGIEKVKTYDDD